MGFLDKLLGRKKADAPHTAPEPPSMPAAGTGGAAPPAEHSHGEGEEHSHEGEHGHEH